MNERGLTAEQRVRAVLEVLRRKYSVEQAASTYGVAVEVLQDWQRRFMEAGTDALATDAAPQPDAREVLLDSMHAQHMLSTVVPREEPFPSLERGCEGVPCFWLLTTGRSGTTTLARMLDHVGGIDAPHEPYPLLLREGALALGGHELPPESAVRLLQLARGLLLASSWSRRSVYFECSPLLSHLAEAIRTAFRSARFVHLVRHPRDFVVSALAQGWLQGDAPITGTWSFTPEPDWEPWQQCIWLWGEVHRKALSLEQRWGDFVVHRVYTEELFRDARAFEDLLVWVGMSPDVAPVNRGAVYQAFGSNRNPSRTRVEWRPEWDEFLARTAGDVMTALYGPDAPGPG